MSIGNPANITRVSGMATGIDTDMLVKAMSQTQQNKVDMLFKQKTLMEWRRDAINNVNDLISTFKSDFTSVLGANSMMRAETFRTMSIRNPNEAAATIRAGVNAQSGSYSLKVDQLATGARFEGERFTTGSAPISITNQTLGSLFRRGDLTATQGDAGAIETTSFTDARGIPQEGFSIEINGTEFNFRETDRLSDVMNAINNSRTANVQLTYSQITNSFTLASKTTGAESKLEVDENGSDFFRALGLNIDAEYHSTYATNGLRAGVDAMFSINNVSLTQSSNSFSYDGIEYTLHNTTTEAFSFHTERNVSGSMDTIKKFVETLNGLITQFNSLHNTRPNRSFFPLTDWAKEDMSESEINKWEDRAKEGVLHRDSQLGRLISSLQSLLSVNTGSGSLRDIGITSAGYRPGQPFQFEINEERLRKALEEEPDRVQNIFTEAADRNSRGPSGGIIARLDAAFDTYSSFTKSHTLQTLRDNINRTGKNINDQTAKLYIQQERLYAQFASFETAMSQMAAQQASVFNFFG
jgi:flagellar hook-associated protein 2